MMSYFLKALFVTLTVLAAPLAAAQDVEPNRILFTNVNVFDGVSDRLESQDVLIEGNLIKQVGRNIDAPEGVTVIDGGGHTLMPGLFDSHVHFNMAIEGGLNEIEASRWDRIGAVAASAAQE